MSTMGVVDQDKFLSQQQEWNNELAKIKLSNEEQVNLASAPESDQKKQLQTAWPEFEKLRTLHAAFIKEYEKNKDLSPGSPAYRAFETYFKQQQQYMLIHSPNVAAIINPELGQYKQQLSQNASLINSNLKSLTESIKEPSLMKSLSDFSKNMEFKAFKEKVNELVTSDNTYIKGLDNLFENKQKILEEVDKSNSLDLNEKNSIYKMMNLSGIIRALAKDVNQHLNVLNEQMTKLIEKGDAISHGEVSDTIEKIQKATNQYAKLYGEYSYLLEVVGKLSSKVKLPHQDLLILPIQRLPRYVMFSSDFQNLLKKPFLGENHFLADAVQKLESVFNKNAIKTEEEVKRIGWNELLKKSEIILKKEGKNFLEEHLLKVQTKEYLQNEIASIKNELDTNSNLKQFEKKDRKRELHNHKKELKKISSQVKKESQKYPILREMGEQHLKKYIAQRSSPQVPNAPLTANPSKISNETQTPTQKSNVQGPPPPLPRKLPSIPSNLKAQATSQKSNIQGPPPPNTPPPPLPTNISSTRQTSPTTIPTTLVSKVNQQKDNTLSFFGVKNAQRRSLKEEAANTHTSSTPSQNIQEKTTPKAGR